MAGGSGENVYKDMKWISEKQNVIISSDIEMFQIKLQ